VKPSIPKGTRDFSPSEMVKRNYIFDTIRQVFKLYGYLPIETPSMENMDTLMGKYGEEGDRLIFKILNSGDFLEGVKDIGTANSKELTKQISEKALRYDLTVPFARYVVMHQNDITFPFKRYQIQPVWRADRPQKGRYREFYQCDADVIGSDSLLNEVELIQIINDVFTKLGVPVIIKINNRKILQGVAEVIGAPDRMIDIAIAIDKLEKINVDGVEEELRQKGFSEEQMKRLNDFILTAGHKVMYLDGAQKGSHNLNALNFLKSGSEYRHSEIFTKGVEELERIVNIVGDAIGTNTKVKNDFSLARGLNYYTGTILEVQVDRTVEVNNTKSTFSSSICGGGRYDDLTGVFGTVQGFEKMSGVGISFGADRIYDVLEEFDNFPDEVMSSTQVMFLNFGDEYLKEYTTEANLLRMAGINVEIYPDKISTDRFDKDRKKQFLYAEKKKIPYVVIIGGNGIVSKVIKVRNMISKEEKEMTSAQLIKYFKTI